MSVRSILLVSVILATLGAAAACAQTQPAYPCRILDAVPEPAYQAHLVYIPPADYEQYGDAPAVEIDGSWELAYYRDLLWGDVEVFARMRSMVLPDDAGLSLPGQLAVTALDLGWTHRAQDGYGVQARIQPGLYSDLEEWDGDALFAPLSCALVRSFGPALSAKVGVDVRPGFEREVLPAVGVAWQPSQVLRVEAMFPESVIEWSLSRAWRSDIGLRWQSSSFAVEDAHEQITVEDSRVYWNLTHRISPELSVSGQLGYVFERSVEFEHTGGAHDHEVDVDETWFAGVGLIGPF